MEKVLEIYERKAQEIGLLVEQKNKAYGDSFAQCGKILQILHPEGIPVEKYDDVLAIVRIIDKLFRIATERDALQESPYDDIAGYAILMAAQLEREKSKV